MKTVFPAGAKARHRSRGNLGIKIDTDSILRRDHILLQRTPTGYFCAGFGKSAAILRAIFEEDLSDLEKSDNDGPLSPFDDPYLRRLALIGTLTKDYDPGEPRDARGRWTSEGGGEAAGSTAVARPISTTETDFTGPGAAGAAALANVRPLPVSSMPGAVAADGVVESSWLGQGLLPTLRGLLSAGAVDVIGGLLAAGFILLRPTNSSLESGGAVPGHPDLEFSFNQDDGSLKIFQAATGVMVFAGNRNSDGTYRDSSGAVVGARTSDGIVFDPNAFPGYASGAPSDDDEKSRAREQTTTATEDKPKFCPKPSPESTAGRSQRALQYQSQIAEIEPGQDYMVGDVRFDGCREEDETLEEAKGPGFSNFIKRDGSWYVWFKGVVAIPKQMDRQSEAAGLHPVEWHFAEYSVAEKFRLYVESQQAMGRLLNIRVFHTPMLPGLFGKALSSNVDRLLKELSNELRHLRELASQW